MLPIANPYLLQNPEDRDGKMDYKADIVDKIKDVLSNRYAAIIGSGVGIGGMVAYRKYKKIKELKKLLKECDTDECRKMIQMEIIRVKHSIINPLSAGLVGGSLGYLLNKRVMSELEKDKIMDDVRKLVDKYKRR